MLVVASIRGQAIGAPNINRCKAPVVICSKLLIIYSLIGWERLAGLAGQPSQKNTVHVNQSAVFLSRINESATILTSQTNRLPIRNGSTKIHQSLSPRPAGLPAGIRRWQTVPLSKPFASVQAEVKSQLDRAARSRPRSRASQQERGGRHAG